MSISNNPGEDSVETNSFAQNMVGTDFANKDWFLFGLGLNADLSPVAGNGVPGALADRTLRSEEHTSELQSLMRISYAVFCLKKKKKSKTMREYPICNRLNS